MVYTDLWGLSFGQWSEFAHHRLSYFITARYLRLWNRSQPRIKDVKAGHPFGRCHTFHAARCKVAGPFLWDWATAQSAISFVAFVLARWFPTCCPPCHETICKKSNPATSKVDGKWDTPSFGEAALQKLVQRILYIKDRFKARIPFSNPTLKTPHGCHGPKMNLSIDR